MGPVPLCAHLAPRVVGLGDVDAGGLRGLPHVSQQTPLPLQGQVTSLTEHGVWSAPERTRIILVKGYL